MQHLAFTDKVKIIRSYVPEKVKVFIENNLSEELKYFQKKYSIKIEILPQQKYIIPEYKIELLNKSKKIINIVQSINKIEENKKSTKLKRLEKEVIRKTKKELKKSKSKKSVRTLWVRRKKKS